ncbi:FAD binding domain-containing protein [Mycena rebaudengoi]|nr:FAD binding domain-containing protein [Mycena rebaudengoi]
MLQVQVVDDINVLELILSSGEDPRAATSSRPTQQARCELSLVKRTHTPHHNNYMPHQDPTVLIAGAGPSGLVLALTLLKNGIPVRIIDKEPKYSIGARGAAVQVRTLELYAILGIPEIVQEGKYLLPMALYKPGEIKPEKTVALQPWKEPTPNLPHANCLIVSQDRHEEILRAHLEKLLVSVELGSELRSFEQFPDHIVAHIVKTDSDGKQSEESTKFGWLIGTDGAHSIVRKQLGLSFLGETKSQGQMALGDIVVEEGVDPNLWHVWSLDSQLMLLRMNGPTSKEGTFMYSGQPEHLKGKILTREEFIEEFYTVTGRRDVKFGEVKWLSSYTPNMRMVDRFRDGRVFVAGDAAHCHSPTGGQGLNASVQDSINLGWKLALVQKGLAPATLLDTYNEERIRVVAHMLHITTQLFEKTFGSTKGNGEQWERGSEMNMLGVNYRGSSIVVDAESTLSGSGAYTSSEDGGVQVAYRAPDASGLVTLGSDAPTTLFTIFSPAMHTVLVFGSDATTHGTVADALKCYSAELVQSMLLLPQGQATTESDVAPFTRVWEDREGHAYTGYGVPPAALTLVVVRPDGYVGVVTKAAEDLGRYFGKIFI